jgi:hypothetical protein
MLRTAHRVTDATTNVATESYGYGDSLWSAMSLYNYMQRMRTRDVDEQTVQLAHTKHAMLLYKQFQHTLTRQTHYASILN